jgi:hypothetical protein
MFDDFTVILGFGVSGFRFNIWMELDLGMGMEKRFGIFGVISFRTKSFLIYGDIFLLHFFLVFFGFIGFCFFMRIGHNLLEELRQRKRGERYYFEKILF